jgi:hypothetical protein
MADAPSSPACANCGAALSDAYCARCGQSREALSQSTFTLAIDWLGDFFSWDGRLWRTLRALYTRPGRVAREFADGKRMTYTPPVRLFLLSTVVLLALMAVLDIRLIAISTRGVFVPPGGSVGEALSRPGERQMIFYTAVDPEGTSAVGFSATLLGIDRDREPVPPDIQARVSREIERDDPPPFIAAAITDPDGVEAAVNAAATQALFAMVALFVLVNMLIHPRRRLIEHLVHALYFHAAGALVLAAWLPLVTLLPIPVEIAAFAAFATFAAGAVLFDRGFYGTTWRGSLWRMPVLVAAYSGSLGVLVAGFTFLMIPR